jgi:flavin reductase (DIM6/NTAB) family NADH-FMN oxidoreductase RutF
MTQSGHCGRAVNDPLRCPFTGLGGGIETARLKMFYEPRKKNHGLPHDPYNAIVGPRPIGWITSINSKGELNLAPYSFFNSVSTDPPIVMFASDGRKDTIEFVEETGEFVCNLAVWDLRQQVKDTSWIYPRGSNEMEAVGLEPAESVLVKPPRVKASPCALECKWLQTVRLKDVDGKPAPRFIAFGQVIGIHIDEHFIKNGLLDTAAMKPIARAGYQEYFVTTEGARFLVDFSHSVRANAHKQAKEVDE